MKICKDSAVIAILVTEDEITQQALMNSLSFLDAENDEVVISSTLGDIVRIDSSNSTFVVCEPKDVSSYQDFFLTRFILRHITSEDKVFVTDVTSEPILTLVAEQIAKLRITYQPSGSLSGYIDPDKIKVTFDNVITSDYDNLEERVSAVEQDTIELDSSLSVLSEDVSTLEQAVSELQNVIVPTSNVVIVGAQNTLAIDPERSSANVTLQYDPIDPSWIILRDAAEEQSLHYVSCWNIAYVKDNSDSAYKMNVATQVISMGEMIGSKLLTALRIVTGALNFSLWRLEWEYDGMNVNSTLGHQNPVLGLIPIPITKDDNVIIMDLSSFVHISNDRIQIGTSTDTIITKHDYNELLKTLTLSFHDTVSGQQLTALQLDALNPILSVNISGFIQFTRFLIQGQAFSINLIKKNYTF